MKSITLPNGMELFEHHVYYGIASISWIVGVFYVLENLFVESFIFIVISILFITLGNFYRIERLEEKVND